MSTEKFVAAAVAAALALGEGGIAPAPQPTAPLMEPRNVEMAAPPPVLPLRAYQQRWIDDHARFKIAVKSARIGFSFATALEAVLDCMEHKTTWTILSASKPQSVEFIQTCATLIEVMQGTVQLYEDEDFYDALGEIEAIQQRITFPNGSRIIALPANPRTARGYPGNAILDEFAHHEESYAIWAAITRQTALGHKVRVLSTPNGEQGKFYDLCKELGLDLGIEPANNYTVFKGWSIYWINADMAIADGCPINMVEMRQLIQDDDIVNQEFYCIFLKAGGAWLPLELIVKAEDGGATVELPPPFLGSGILFRARRLYGGIDVARERDATIFWLKEKVGDVLWTRMVLPLYSMPFPDQAKMLAPYVRLTERTALDSTGMGIALFDLLNDPENKETYCPGRVMGVNFAGSSKVREEAKEKKRVTSTLPDGPVRMKTDLAIKVKRSFEGGKERIPYDLQIRTELQAIKRVPTATGVTFEAPRIEVESAVAGGKAKKTYQHADRFWACALATYAADDGSTVSTDYTTPQTPSTYAGSQGYL